MFDDLEKFLILNYSFILLDKIIIVVEEINLKISNDKSVTFVLQVINSLLPSKDSIWAF